jgi:methionyl-tRNA formyltransferase
VYLGTPDVAVPPLVALDEAGFQIALVVTRPDKRRGRGKGLQPSPVKRAATDLGLPVADELAAIDHLDPPVDAALDLGVVVAYGRIIPTELLERLPMVNLHFSILPRWRGAAPVERAILAGDGETGVCLMAVAPELDTGDVYACNRITIGDDDTLDGLRGRLVDLGARMVVEELSAGLGPPQPQDGEVTYAAKISPDEYRLDFTKPAAELDRTIRLGRAWCSFREKRLKINEAAPIARPANGVAVDGPSPGTLTDLVPTDEHGPITGPAVATGDGWLLLRVVQPEGKKPMDAASWRNGVRPEPGERLA